MSFFEELKRRNVFRVGIAYGVAAWLLIQITDTVFPRIGLSDSAVTLVIALLAIGFIPALIFAWAFEMTPEGLKRDADVDRAQSSTPQTAKKLDRVIIAGLLLVIVAMGVERYWFAEDKKGSGSMTTERGVPAAGSTEAIEPDPFTSHQQSVAVLPFAAMSSGEDDGYFADGLTEEILNSLARLPELLVTARTSSFHFKDQNLPVQEIAATLGVDHIVEGSVRRAGEQVRITAQLVRATDGFHLWSETYDRTLEDVFAVQEDIATNIAETLDVVLNEERLALMRQSGIKDVQAFIDYQKGWEAFNRAHSTDNPLRDLPEANRYFDRVIERAPRYANAWFMRTDLFGHIIYNNASNLQPASQEVLDEAMRELQESLEMTARLIRSPAQRANIEGERLYLGDDWTGIPAKIEAALDSDECFPMNWLPTLAGAFGWAESLVAHFRRMLVCDPLNGLVTTIIINNLIWAGDAEAAFDVADDYLRNNEFNAWIDDGRFLASLATGQYRDIPESYGPNPEGSNFWAPRAIYTYAMDGELDRARALFDEYIAANPWDDVSRITVGAALGDRDMANAAAAAIDARFAGPFLLAEITKWCACGAPFDINVTPNFKARIEEAGFTWPPASPIRYPAKDW